MRIALLKTQVNNLNFKRNTSSEEDTATSRPFQISYTSLYDDERPKVFAIVFDLKIEQENSFSLTAEFSAWFATSEPIDQAFKKSDWTAINAPAIAFPFLRAFISNFTLQAGLEPLTLPAINFVELVSKQQADNK